MNNNKDEIVLFENGELALEVNVSPQLETVWLSSNQMALLYGRDEKTIRKHVNKIFTDGELERESNTQKMRVVLFFQFTFGKDIIDMFSYSLFIPIK